MYVVCTENATNKVKLKCFLKKLIMKITRKRVKVLILEYSLHFITNYILLKREGYTMLERGCTKNGGEGEGKRVDRLIVEVPERELNERGGKGVDGVIEARSKVKAKKRGWKRVDWLIEVIAKYEVNKRRWERVDWMIETFP